MKARSGFVSNSSSSSFVVVTTLENHERAVAKLGPYGKAVMRAMEEDDNEGFCKKAPFLGRACISFSTLSVMDSDPFDGFHVDYDEEEVQQDDDEDTASNVFDKYVELVKESPKEAFTHCSSMG